MPVYSPTFDVGVAVQLVQGVYQNTAFFWNVGKNPLLMIIGLFLTSIIIDLFLGRR